MKAFFNRTALIAATIACAAVLLGRQATSNPARAKGGQAKGVTAKMTSLLTERRDLLRQMETLSLAQYKAGRGNLEELNRASRAAIHADLDLPHTRAERVALQQQWVDKTQEYEKLAEERNRAGAALQTEVIEAHVAHLEAEIDLEREKSGRVTR